MSSYITVLNYIWKFYHYVKTAVALQWPNTQLAYLAKCICQSMNEDLDTDDDDY